jgi:oxygen-independent coproporphyrinogen-3 oxidase
MKAEPIGLYVHIPFCKKKCNYCDFCSYSDLDSDTREGYIKALIREILSYRKEERIKADTVFFGGGTPSLLLPEEFGAICDAIEYSFEINRDAEFTIEANPKTLTKEKLSSYISRGVNRISIGLQTIHENERKMLGRIHNLDDFLHSYKIVCDAGITNISVDLMFGIPEQTIESFRESIDFVASSGVNHISLYGLIVEEGTPFFETLDSLVLPNEDEEREMYFLMCEKLKNYGYEHYEISNFAKSGYASRHNLKYWQAHQYIGVGISAYSNFNGMRYGNSKMLSMYLNDSYLDFRDLDFLTDEDLAFEYAMLHLRLKDGFSLKDYKDRFGIDFLVSREEKIKYYENQGLLSVINDRIFLTEAGFFLSNTILSDLL